MDEDPHFLLRASNLQGSAGYFTNVQVFGFADPIVSQEGDF